MRDDAQAGVGGLRDDARGRVGKDAQVKAARFRFGLSQCVAEVVRGLDAGRPGVGGLDAGHQSTENGTFVCRAAAAFEKH